jgi:hypothetical protein
VTTNPTIARIGLNGSPIPPEGERAIGPLTYDFSAANSVDVNLRAQMENLSLISFAMSVYIDNSLNPNFVTLTAGEGQILAVQGYSQGWYPFVSQRPIRYRIQCAAGSGVTTLFFTNFHVSSVQWLTR